MSKFKAFMKGENRILTKKVFLADRFIDENGNEVPFVIRTVTPKELKECRTNATIVDENGASSVNNELFEMEMIKMSVVVPDLKDSELQDCYEAMGEEELINEMLSAGEYTTLVNEITKFNNFNGYRQRVEKAKN